MDGFTQFLVVRNALGQYSIWPAALELPNGWEAMSEPAGREVCLRRIEERWLDIRPRATLQN